MKEKSIHMGICLPEKYDIVEMFITAYRLRLSPKTAGMLDQKQISAI